MKREILFRGKTFKGEWVHGYLIEYENSTQIGVRKCADVIDFVKVKPETIGQFTGLTDKNGTKIFEGDKVKMAESHFNIEIIGFTLYIDGRFLIKSIKSGAGWDANREVEVIGNIHDNPELT